MRCLVLVLAAACGNSVAPAGSDAGLPSDSGILWPDDGVYDVTYAVDELGLAECGNMVLSDNMAQLAIGDCYASGLARQSSTCVCYDAPSVDTRDWCLCPGVDRLIGSVWYADGSSVAAELQAFPR